MSANDFRGRARSWTAGWALLLSFAVIIDVGAICAIGALAQTTADEMRPADRRRLQSTLTRVVREVRENYYDPTFGGRDLDALAEVARRRVESARSIGEALGAIAQFTLELDDSHTFFLPPFQTVDVDYGWEVGIVGDAGVVLDVKPGSDAEKQGVRRGDTVKTINGFPVSRESLWKLEYLFNQLRPQPGLRAELTPPQGPTRELDLAAEVKPRRRVLELEGEGAGFGWARIEDDYNEYRRKHRLRFAKAGEGVLIAKLREFTLSDDEPKKLLSAARGKTALILDLRENAGGEVAALEAVVAGLFADDLVVATFKEREKTKELRVRGSKRSAFDGRLWVLIDAQSASASELLARTVQLSGRGQVIGERSSGSVRVGRVQNTSVSHGDFVIASGVNVTEADVVMPDGERLEKRGVVPDVPVVPTPADLAAGRDPALAKALALAGAPMDASAAGALFAPDPR